MTEYTGSYFTENEILRPIELFRPQIFEKGLVIYEVLRMQEGKALFFEDHFSRFHQSVLLSGYKLPVEAEVLKKRLSDLAEKNRIDMGNVKIIAFFHSAQADIFTFFIPHSYPTEEMYSHGVAAAFFEAERPDPNIKKMHPDMIRRISAFIKDQEIYDVLLVDKSGCVTEGSRTNVFFIKNNQVLTSPGDKVLKGITREKLIFLCNRLRIPLVEKPITRAEIQTAGAAFFSGTSPKILPIRFISGWNYKVTDPILGKLMQAYDELIQKNLKAG
ncbi:MAG TPA: aminotransferase class IV [Bacteroidales bacterium]|nr:aminotransferase class IV [Bacteroidales bacterium]